jgi:GH24 family phage-related lysozyme (muramidase)
MHPSLSRYALATIAGHPSHEAFWAAVEELLTPKQRQRLEMDGDIRNATWLKGGDAPAATPTAGTAWAPVVAVALPLVKEFEGCRLTAYPDPETGGDPWTIGWGSTIHANGEPVRFGDTITQAEADALLALRLKRDYRALTSRITGWEQLNVNERAALLSFTYNCGTGWFGSAGFATLTGCVQSGLQSDERELAKVPAALMLYVNPGGPSEAGLRRRRKAEGALWNAQ